MDIYYLKEAMFEELEGAEGYLHEAQKLKTVRPDWAKIFYEMGLVEVEHSRTLNNMFTEHFNSLNTDPTLYQYMEPFKESVDKEYAKKVGEIRYMQDTYSKK